MDNVSTLKKREDIAEVDLTDEQMCLVGAETAAADSLHQYFTAGAALMRFMKELKVRPSDPRAVRMLEGMQTHLSNSVKTMLFIERCHGYTNEMMDERSDLEIKLVGGIPKNKP
ncbi:MAG: hypothetical protein AAF720_07535 [Pseudomonadota bacterium]